jgi:hypothetical protein
VAIVGSYGLYSRPELGVYCRGVPYGQAVVPGHELCRKYLLRDRRMSVTGAATFTLFRSDLVRSRHAFYNESNFHADSEAYLELLEHHDFGFVQQILTFMRVEEGSLSSFTDRVNTYLPHLLEVQVKYGPKHLTPEELTRAVGATLREYYEYLAWQVTKRRDRAFWRLHRGKLAAAGYPLSTARLAAHVALYLLGLLLHPGRVVEGVADRMRRAVLGREPASP